MIGNLNIEVSELNMFGVAHDAIRPLLVHAKEKEIEFSVIGCNKSMLPENIVTLGDNIKLGQVIRNLISNALKFTPSGQSVTVTGTWDRSITISHVLHKNKNKCYALYEMKDYTSTGVIIIEVKDTGHGMSVENLKDLFKEGVQFDVNQLQAGGGSGLGLWISKGIVELHGGQITGESEGIGLGSTFTVMIPVYERQKTPISENPYIAISLIDE